MIRILKILAWCAAVASAGAAWFAAINGYIDRHSAFTPVVAFGTPVLKVVDGVVSIALPLSLANSGGKSGCIADLALKLQSKATNTRWMFFPAFFLDVTSYLRSMPGKEEFLKSVESPAMPLKLAGHEKLVKGVLFMPRPMQTPPLAPLRVRDLVPDDTHRVQVSIVAAGPDCLLTSESKFVQAASAEFLLRNHEIEELQRRLAVLPLDVVRDSIRNDLLQSP